jgi:hypothetical protein
MCPALDLMLNAIGLKVQKFNVLLLNTFFVFINAVTSTSLACLRPQQECPHALPQQRFQPKEQTKKEHPACSAQAAHASSSAHFAYSARLVMPSQQKRAADQPAGPCQLLGPLRLLGPAGRAKSPGRRESSGRPALVPRPVPADSAASRPSLQPTTASRPARRRWPGLKRIAVSALRKFCRAFRKLDLLLFRNDGL